MKEAVKQPQFWITDPATGQRVGVDNMYIIFTGDIPGCVERENLMPGDYKEARELAEQHNMYLYNILFTIEVAPYPLTTQGQPDRRIGMYFGTDHKGNIQYFHLPEGSIFRAMKLSELAAHHGWDYEQLQEATLSIKFCYEP